MKRYLAELIGTFALVFFGTGVVIINDGTKGAIISTGSEVASGQITHVGIAITFGLIIMCMIYALGHISGAHLNPAVSIAFALSGKFAVKDLLPYIISQLVGALLASLVLRSIFPGNEHLGATLPAGSVGQAFILEFILTFFLMLVIINVATGSKEQGMFAGLAIGSVILLGVMLAGPVSGGSMNPARSLAPAFISGHTEHLWIYLTATVAGAACAIPVWKYLNTHVHNKQEAK